MTIIPVLRRQSSSVGRAAGYGLEGPGFDSRIRCQTFRTAPRFTQPPINTGCFPGVKGGQSVVPTTPLHSSAEVMESMGLYLLAPQVPSWHVTGCLRWAGHVARMGESKNAYRVLVGRPEGKDLWGGPRRSWEDNIKMDLREVGYDDRDWINLAQDRDRWRAYVRAGMNLQSALERIPNLSAEQSDGITVFRISTMMSLMIHRCAPVPPACRGGGSILQPSSVNVIGSCIGRELADE
ncbi:hypothetical protein ANN_12847 [Periplaneta americana]|uniref:Uncharacterized protein n=1 Tax=Periplaneta americana TaxID=6978 RepID=A0ABQ8THQ7_PERAM|nr:hypothetical protein ANN_12847 [Periplaneta americana]